MTNCDEFTVWRVGLVTSWLAALPSHLSR